MSRRSSHGALGVAQDLAQGPIDVGRERFLALAHLGGEGL